VGVQSSLTLTTKLRTVNHGFYGQNLVQGAT